MMMPLRGGNLDNRKERVEFDFTVFGQKGVRPYHLIVHHGRQGRKARGQVQGAQFPGAGIAEAQEVTGQDHLGQTLRIDDLIEDCIQALAVAAFRCCSESDQ